MVYDTILGDSYFPFSCMYKCVCVCLTLKGRMQIADEYAAAPYREMIA